MVVSSGAAHLVATASPSPCLYPLQCVVAGSVTVPCTTSDPNCAQCGWGNKCVKCKTWNMKLDPATNKVRASSSIET